jgi:hypothetical protein
MPTVAAGAAALMIASLAAVRAAERVDWMNTANVAVRGNGVQKTGGCEGCDDAVATSRQTVTENGYVEFTVGESYTFWMAGLDRRPGSGRWNDIDYAFRFNGNDSADVMERGNYRGGDTYYQAGDRFRIAVVDGRVRYIHNGTTVYESAEVTRGPLTFKVVLGSMGASIRNVMIEPGGRRFTYNDRSYGNDRYRPRDYDYGVGTTGTVITVDPTEQWNDTGLWVEAGDMLTFDAQGRIRMSSGGDDVASPSGSRLGRMAPNAPLPAQPAGLLLARIGNSAPVPVGAHRTARAPVSGELYVGVNDDYVGDNSGAYRVNITVEPRYR